MLTNYGEGRRLEILLYPRQFLLQLLMNCKAHRLLYIQKKGEVYCSFTINFPARYAIGIYAPARSRTVNHTGDGSIITLKIPPARKRHPINNANFILWLTVIFCGQQRAGERAASNHNIRFFPTSNLGISLLPSQH